MMPNMPKSLPADTGKESAAGVPRHTGARRRSVDTENRPSGAGRRPNRGGAGTRRALIDGAIVSLREAGYAGTTARSVAERAGVNQALVFYHFGSMPDLLYATLTQISEDRQAAYEPALAAAAALSDLVALARRVYAEDRALGYTAVASELIAAAPAIDGFGPRIGAVLAQWEDFAARALGRAAELTGLPLPGRDLAPVLVACVLGMELLGALRGEQDLGAGLLDRLEALAATMTDEDTNKGDSAEELRR